MPEDPPPAPDPTPSDAPPSPPAPDPTPWAGLLCIGDPHLASRSLDFRRDDYPRVALDKLAWCLGYARARRLLPVILGDLFHYPRDNATWLLVALIDLLDPPPLIVPGNHDMRERALTEHDTLTLLARAGRLRRVDRVPWRGSLGGRATLVGGTAWGEVLPARVMPPDDDDDDGPPLVIWLTHHDVGFPGHEVGCTLRPTPLPGVDLVINGHIHEALAPHTCGPTTWLNPGNISRVNRKRATLAHVPAALRVHVDDAGSWRAEHVIIPHAPADAAFHPIHTPTPLEMAESAFVQGLGDLLARRTDTGAGLAAFLDQNLNLFSRQAADELRALAAEVRPDDEDPLP